MRLPFVSRKLFDDVCREKHEYRSKAERAESRLAALLTAVEKIRDVAEKELPPTCEVRTWTTP